MQSLGWPFLGQQPICKCLLSSFVFRVSPTLWGAASLQPRAFPWALTPGALQRCCKVLVGAVPVSPVKAANKGFPLWHMSYGPGTVLNASLASIYIPSQRPREGSYWGPLLQMQSPTARGSGMAFVGPNPELFRVLTLSFSASFGSSLNLGMVEICRVPTSQPLTPVCLSLYRSNFLGDSDSYGCREKSTPS